MDPIFGLAGLGLLIYFVMKAAGTGKDAFQREWSKTHARHSKALKDRHPDMPEHTRHRLAHARTAGGALFFLPTAGRATRRGWVEARQAFRDDGNNHRDFIARARERDQQAKLERQQARAEQRVSRDGVPRRDATPAAAAAEWPQVMTVSTRDGSNLPNWNRPSAGVLVENQADLDRRQGEAQRRGWNTSVGPAPQTTPTGGPTSNPTGGPTGGGPTAPTQGTPHAADPTPAGPPANDGPFQPGGPHDLNGANGTAPAVNGNGRPAANGAHGTRDLAGISLPISDVPQTAAGINGAGSNGTNGGNAMPTTEAVNFEATDAIYESMIGRAEEFTGLIDQMCASIKSRGVDAETVGATAQIADVAGAVTGAVRTAQGVHRTNHGKINEAVKSNPVPIAEKAYYEGG